MKTFIILILTLRLAFSAAYGQTHYGTGAGTLGFEFSHFGYYADNAATGTSGANCFMGAYSGRQINTGRYNIAVGAGCLNKASNANSNTVFGADVLPNLLNGYEIVAIGRHALHSQAAEDLGPDAIPPGNSVFGYKAAYSYAVGDYNTAVGSMALEKANVSEYSTA